MKKINFLKQAICLCALLFTIDSANAQVGIGVKGGLNLSKLTFDVKNDPNTINNFYPAGSFGLVANFKFNKFFSLQPELLYSEQGTKLVGKEYIYSFTMPDGTTYSSTSPAGEAILQLNYFQIPILTKISIGSEKVRGFINVGPYLGYLLSGKEKNSSQGKEREEKIDFDDATTKETINRIDLGVSGGLGIAFKVGPGDIFVEGRYNLGLIDIIKGEVRKQIYYEAIYNRVINFSAGYIFFFGEK